MTCGPIPCCVKTMKEIGSEFGLEPLGRKQNPLPDGVSFTLSGRTALELALKDIGSRPGKALLPDWCCASMVEPFRAAGMAVEFYAVDGGEAPAIPDDCTVLLRCGYFGYADSWIWDTPEGFCRRGGVVIEDITHSLFSEAPCHEGSGYLVASLRKWGPLLCGGLCVKTGGELRAELTQPPRDFLDMRQEAMELKAACLREGSLLQKERFRALFAESNRWLSRNWQGMAMDEQSLDMLARWDVAEMCRRRRENARFLHEKLMRAETVRPLYALREGDCPLFVPVSVAGGRRDELQRRLIGQGIYCPVHWPRPAEGCRSERYDTELSLVCDQRYNLSDMTRIIEVIEG